MFSPATLDVAMVSLEGPDQYSMAGGLGVRARELCRALAAEGHATSLYFVGDPGRPERELEEGVQLVRCVRDISQRHPAGVYEGEAEKIAELERSLPAMIVDEVVRPAAERGAVAAVLCEEWQTVGICVRLHQLLVERGLRRHCVVLWNANNHFGFDAIDWTELGRASAITTVSRYMKHLMWPYRVNPIVVPNGIPESALVAPSEAAVAAIRGATSAPCLTFKIGRFSGDKRWHQALDAIAELRRDGMAARMLIRGGIEAYGHEVLGHAHHLGLDVATWSERIPDHTGIVRALAETGDAPIINLTSFLPDAVLPEIEAAVDAVLANSGHEPFGLVGLEAMAAGALAVVGATGEDYAHPFGNAIVIETDLATELANALRGVIERPALARRLRRAGRRDAAEFTWPKIIDGLVERLRFLASQQGVTEPGRRPRATTGRRR